MNIVNFNVRDDAIYLAFRLKFANNVTTMV